MWNLINFTIYSRSLFKRINRTIVLILCNFHNYIGHKNYNTLLYAINTRMYNPFKCISDLETGSLEINVELKMLN